MRGAREFRWYCRGGGWLCAFAIFASICRAQPSALPDKSDIETALGFTHAYALVSARNSGRIAWVTNHRGQRAIWTAEPPDYEVRPVAEFGSDDGLEIGDLSLSDQGDVVVFSRNADSSRSVGGVNPLSLLLPPGEEIWLGRPARGGGFESRKVAEGRRPLLSPDGRRLVWLANGEILTRLLHLPEAADELALRPQGQITRYVFSPDSRSLAMVVDRGAHSLIGVMRFGEPSIHWLSPDMSRDDFPVWSPDGRKIAFLRFLGLRYDDRFPLILGSRRFSVYVTDVQGGSATRIWSSPGADGGYAQDVGLALAWSNSNRIIFQSEHDGWLRPYAIDPDGSGIVPLSSGNCEIEHATLDQQLGRLIHANNCGDPARRHIWASDLETGKMVPLSAGDGIEVNPVVLSTGQGIAVLASTTERPFAVALLNSGKQNALRLPGAGAVDKFRSASPRIRLEEVVLTADDEVETYAQLIREDIHLRSEVKKPALVFVHGGPHRQMLSGWNPLRYYSVTYALNRYFAAQGYVVLSLNYRSGTGYGREFREAVGQGPEGGLEHRDLLAAARYLRSIEDVDPARIAIWGGSQGGVLVALALSRSSDVFAAGVDLHGVHDWSRFGFGQLGIDPWTTGEVERGMFDASSPVANIDRWTSPVLIISGDDDSAVDVRQSVDLVARLRDRGVEVDALVLPGEEHDLRLHASWVRIARTMEAFLGRSMPRSIADRAGSP